MTKMVVSSFYNTLIDYEEAIPVSTMLEIERIRNKGIVFSVCTNRNYQELLDYNHDFPFLDYIISLNGSIVYDVLKEKIIYQKKLTKKVIEKIEKNFNQNAITYYKENNNIYKIDIDITNSTIKDKDMDIDSINKSIFIKDNKTYLEITSNLTDNYKALEKILEKRKIKKEEVLGIVANNSDFPLVTNLSTVYLMENSPLKTNNPYTTSNNDDGLYKILKEI